MNKCDSSFALQQGRATESLTRYVAVFIVFTHVDVLVLHLIKMDRMKPWGR